MIARTGFFSFTLPNENVSNASWQKVTLSLSSFANQEWDAGYGTDTPDANPKDINAVGLMVVGNEVNQVGKFYVDDIQFISKTATSTVSGTVKDGANLLADTTVYAIDQSSIRQTVTDKNGVYSFTDLDQGKQYRLIPLKKGYDFSPVAVTLTLQNATYTQDFAAAASPL